MIVNLRKHQYWQVVIEASSISQHLSTIALFIAVFIHLYSFNLSATIFFIITTTLTFCGYIFWDFTITRTLPHHVHRSRF